MDIGSKIKIKTQVKIFGGNAMLQINMKLIIDENQTPVAVIIPIEEFKKIEQILEDYGLAKLMEEAENDDILNYEEAIKYYKSLKNVES